MHNSQLANLTLSFLNRSEFKGSEFNDFKLVVEWLQGQVMQSLEKDTKND